jgi:enamine deaminase RidA (YjgF/YER057c/UK114 family)
MSIEKINPSALAEPQGYAHVAIAEGTRRVYLAGQVGVGPDGAVVGADLTSQTAQAFRNVATALDAAGATWDAVAKMTIYIVDYGHDKGAEFFAGVAQVFDGGMPTTAATLIGVQSLYQPDLLIEIDATAEI